MRLSFKILLFFFVLSSCKQVQNVADAISNPSARDVFERELKANDSLFEIYKTLYDNSKKNQLHLELPAVVTSKSDVLQPIILSYDLELERGERFKIQSNRQADSLQLYMDIFEYENDSTVSKKQLASNTPKSNKLELDIKKNGKYRVVIFSETKNKADFGLVFFTEPTFGFPVSGKDNGAIQSYWGASRSGGKRSHEGIDIFASRGTPVIAATNGYISSTGNRGLGGKQVWLRDGVFGQSLYYAHLDSILVSGGKRVKIGDTLGLVGNSGNAKTTSPHLHFGIYTSAGAINPLPFVELKDHPKIMPSEIVSKGITTLRTNELRVGAGVKNKKIMDLEPNVQVSIMAKTNQWFHLKVNDSLEGFMHESLVSKVK